MDEKYAGSTINNLHSLRCIAKSVAIKVAQSHSVSCGLASVREVLCLTTIPVAETCNPGGAISAIILRGWGDLNTRRKTCSGPTLSHHKSHITWPGLETKRLRRNKHILVYVTLKTKPSFVEVHIFYNKYFVLYKDFFSHCTPIKLNYLTSRPPG